MQVHKRAILDRLGTKEKGVNKPMQAFWATSLGMVEADNV